MEGPQSLRIFGCLPGAGARGWTEAGVRKASREETAGEFAPTLVSVYGDLGAVYAVIFRLIGIGGHLAMPPLPHHRAYGSVPRRFDWVKLGQRHGVGGDRVSRNSGCAGLVGPPGVRTCARTPSVNRRRPLH